MCRALEDYDYVFADLDGVIWIEGEPIEENLKVLRSLASEGRLVVLTNNSTRSRRAYSSMLRSKAGLNVGPDKIVTSAYAASKALTARLGGPSRVIALGEEGLVEELILEGHTVYALRDAAAPDAVVVGLDRNLTYDKLLVAARAIAGGALFIATNTDNALPTSKGLVPGAGAIVSALHTATGREPDIVAGKPSQGLAALLEELYKPRKALVIGDRVDTDIAFSINWGVDAMLVLTGVHSRMRPKPLEALRHAGNVRVAGSLEELCRD